MKKNAYYCFLLLITNALVLSKLYQSNHMLHTDPENAEPTIKVIPSVITVFADSSFKGIYLNSNRIANSEIMSGQAASEDEKVEKKVSLVLYKGDIITLSAKGSCDLNGIIGSIQFFDGKGKEHIYNTDEKWFCNGEAPKTNACEREPLPAETTIPPDAKWIWADIDQGEVLCSFIIPCEK